MPLVCPVLEDILEENNATFECNLEEGVKYNGGSEVLGPDLDLFITKNYEECAMLCSGSTACKFWSFEEEPSFPFEKKCYLTSTAPTEKTCKPTAYSGSRMCGMFIQSKGK